MMKWIVTIMALVIQLYGINQCKGLNKKQLVLLGVGVSACQIANINIMLTPISWYRNTFFIYLMTQMSIKDIQSKMVETEDLIFGFLMSSLGIMSIFFIELIAVETNLKGIWLQFQSDLRTIILQIIIASSIFVVGCLLSRVSRKSIGMGDIWVLTLTGLFFEWQSIVMIFWLAMILSGFMSMFMLLVKHKSKQYRLPFIPFIGSAMVITIMMSSL